jgi:hypothetical protein
MKVIVILTALFMSFGVFAKDVEQTISEIESQRDATCYQGDVSMRFCLNTVCVHYENFQCVENKGIFKVRLKVLTKELSDGSYEEKVKKVIYLK